MGTRPSTTITVWVNALDASGMRLARVEARPTPQVVPPGTVARYVVALPNDPAVRGYHVEAIGR